MQHVEVWLCVSLPGGLLYWSCVNQTCVYIIPKLTLLCRLPCQHGSPKYLLIGHCIGVCKPQLHTKYIGAVLGWPFQSVITTTRKEPEYFCYDHCGCDVQSQTLLIVLPSKADFVHHNQMGNKIEQVQKKWWYSFVYVWRLPEWKVMPSHSTSGMFASVCDCIMLNEWIQNWNGPVYYSTVPHPILTLCSHHNIYYVLLCQTCMITFHYILIP